MACPNDARALMTWGERLLTFPDAGGLGQAGLHDMLELELLNRADLLSHAGSRGPWGLRPMRLAVSFSQRGHDEYWRGIGLPEEDLGLGKDGWPSWVPPWSGSCTKREPAALRHRDARPEGSEVGVN
jgi:hypothetical protein